MADELEPVAPDLLVRGELVPLLTDLLTVQVETAAAAAPWLSGDVRVPLIQLNALARKLRDLQAVAQTAGEEVNRVYAETKRRREEAQAQLDGAA